MEWDLTCPEAVLFAFLFTLPSWAESRVIDGTVHSYIAKAKILRELPMLTDKPDTVYRHIKKLSDKGLVNVVRQGGAMFIAITEKGQSWNRVQSPMQPASEINPNLGNKSEPRKNIRDTSEKNPNDLGNISDISEYQSSDYQESGQSPSDDGSPAGADLLGDRRSPIAASRSTKPAEVPERQIVDLYHEMLPGLPRVAKLTEKRRQWLKARWHDDPGHQSLGFWRRYFELVQRSPHLLGQNDRGWTANFEWLLNSSNFVKTIEGQYLAKDKAHGASGGHHSANQGKSLLTRLAKRGREARAERDAQGTQGGGHGQ